MDNIPGDEHIDNLIDIPRAVPHESGCMVSPDHMASGWTPLWCMMMRADMNPWPRPPVGLGHSVDIIKQRKYVSTGLYQRNRDRGLAKLIAVDAIAVDADAADWMYATGQAGTVEYAKTLLREMSDADYEKTLGAHRNVALNFLAAAGVPAPTRIICSGYGLHMWWHLDRAYYKTAPEFATVLESTGALIERVNQLFAPGDAKKQLFDRCAKDTGARMLAIPGDYNRKGRTPRMVKLSGWSDTVLDLPTLESWVGVKRTVDALTGVVRVSRPAHLGGAGRHPVVHIDFRMMQLRGGGTMYDAAMAMPRGTEKRCDPPAPHDGHDSFMLHHEADGRVWGFHYGSEAKTYVHYHESDVSVELINAGEVDTDTIQEGEPLRIVSVSTSGYAAPARAAAYAGGLRPRIDVGEVDADTIQEGEPLRIVSVSTSARPKVTPKTLSVSTPRNVLRRVKLEQFRRNVPSICFVPKQDREKVFVVGTTDIARAAAYAGVAIDARIAHDTPDPVEEPTTQSLDEDWIAAATEGEDAPAPRPTRAAIERAIGRLSGARVRSTVCTRNTPWSYVATHATSRILTASRLACMSYRCPDCAPTKLGVLTGATQEVIHTAMKSHNMKSRVIKNLGDKNTMARWAAKAPSHRRFIVIDTGAHTYTIVMYADGHAPTGNAIRTSAFQSSFDAEPENDIDATVNLVKKFCEEITPADFHHTVKRITPVSGQTRLTKAIHALCAEMLGRRKHVQNPDVSTIVTWDTRKKVIAAIEDRAVSTVITKEKTAYNHRLAAEVGQRILMGLGSDPTPIGGVFATLIAEGAIRPCHRRRASTVTAHANPPGRYDDDLEIWSGVS